MKCETLLGLIKWQYASWIWFPNYRTLLPEPKNLFMTEPKDQLSLLLSFCFVKKLNIDKWFINLFIIFFKHFWLEWVTSLDIDMDPKTHTYEQHKSLVEALAQSWLYPNIEINLDLRENDPLNPDYVKILDLYIVLFDLFKDVISAVNCRSRSSTEFPWDSAKRLCIIALEKWISPHWFFKDSTNLRGLYEDLISELRAEGFIIP